MTTNYTDSFIAVHAFFYHSCTNCVPRLLFLLNTAGSSKVARGSPIMAALFVVLSAVIAGCNAQYGPYSGVTISKYEDYRQIAVYRSDVPDVTNATAMIGSWLVVDDQYLLLETRWSTSPSWWYWTTSPTMNGTTGWGSYTVQFCSTNPCPSDAPSTNPTLEPTAVTASPTQGLFYNLF